MKSHDQTERRWLRRTAIGVFVLAGILGVLPLSLVVAAQTTRGRRVIADAVLRRLNANLPGRVTVGSIDSLGLGTLTGRDLRILDAGGRETLRLLRFSTEFELGRALGGDLVVTSASVDGGRVVLEELASGRIRLENSVSRPSRVRTPTAEFDFRHIQFRGIALVILPDGAPVFRLRGLHGAIALRKRPMSAVRLDIMSVDGVLRTPGWNDDIGIHDAVGRVDGDAHRLLELRGTADVASDDPCSWSLAYGSHPEPWMSMAFEPEGVASELLSAELHLFATFSPILSME